MPPTPPRNLVQILRSLAEKDLELGKMLFPEAGQAIRGFYPEGSFKLSGSPVLTGNTVSDKASAAKLLLLAKDLPPAEASKVRNLARALVTNLEARSALRGGTPVEIFPGHSTLGRALGQRNAVSPEQMLALVKEATSSPLYKGPSFEELMRMAKGNPLKLLLPPNVVRGAQQRGAFRAIRSAASEARSRGEAFPFPKRPPPPQREVLNPKETIQEMRESGEGAIKGRYAPVLPLKEAKTPPKKLEDSGESPTPKAKGPTTKATLSDLLPGVQFEPRGGKIYISWRGQEPITLAEAAKALSSNEPYTGLLLKKLVGLEQHMRSLPTPSGKEASDVVAKKLRVSKRYVEDPSRPSGHVETSWQDIQASREERMGPAERRADLRRYLTGETSPSRQDYPKTEPKPPSEKQLALFLKKTGLELPKGTESTPAQARLENEIRSASPIGPLFPLSGLTANQVGKYLNRAIINEEMAKRGGIPKQADVQSGYGSKQRIALRNQLAKAMEEAAQQRGSEGRAVLAEALKKASKQERPRTAAATALLGLRGMKKLGIEDAQAQLIDALLSQPGGDRILQQLTQKAITRGDRGTSYGKIRLVPQPKPEPRRAVAGRVPGKPSKPIEIARPTPAQPARPPEVLQDYPRQEATKPASDLASIMQKYKKRVHPLDWERFIIDLWKQNQATKQNASRPTRA